MAEPIGALRAELSAGHAQFAADMKKAKDAVKSNGSAMQRIMATVGDRFTRAAKALTSFRSIAAGAAMMAGMAYAIKRNLEYADTIAKTADKIGISTKALQEYRYIADRSGVSTDKLDEALGAFGKRIGELRMGTGTLYTILNKNNKGLMEQLIAAEDTSTALDIYFDTLKKTENQNDRAALASAAFGRSAGVAMTNMVDDVDTLKERFTRLGVEIDEKLLRQSEAAKDNIDDLQLVIKNSLARALVAVGPELGQAAADMATWVASNKDFLSQDVPGKIQDMAKGVKDFVNSPVFSAMKEYWELAAGAAIGLRLGGPTGALIGAGAGGWVSVYGDIKDMIGETTEEATEYEAIQAAIARKTREIGELNQKIEYPLTDSGAVERYKKEIQELQYEIAVLTARLRGLKRVGAGGAATPPPSPSGGGPSVGGGTVSTNTESITKQIDALKMQRDTFGGTAKEVALYHLKMQGATRAQLEQAAAILDEIAARRKATEGAEAEAKATEAAEKAIESQINALEMQRGTFGMTTEEATLYKISIMEGVTPAQIELARTILETVKAQNEQNTLMEEGKTLTESMLTPQEQYNKTIEHLKTLLDAGAISQETYNRAVEKAKGDLEGFSDKGKDAVATLGDAIKGWGRESADAIADFAVDGKTSFSDMINSMIHDLVKMAAYEQVTSPLFKSISGGLASIFGGGRATGGPVSAGRMYEVNERGAPELLSVGNRQFLMMAQESGTVTPAAAAGASGGSGGGGGSTEVNIYNNVGAQVTTSERQTAGGKEITVMIDHAVAKNLGQKGSASNRAMKHNYGASEQLIRR